SDVCSSDLAAAELEDVSDLDSTGQVHRAGAVGRGIAGTDVGDLDGSVRGEVPPGDEVEHMPSVNVGAGDTPGPGNDPRIKQVSDPRGSARPLGGAEILGRLAVVGDVCRTDIAADQCGH